MSAAAEVRIDVALFDIERHRLVVFRGGYGKIGRRVTVAGTRLVCDWMAMLDNTHTSLSLTEAYDLACAWQQQQGG